MLIYKSIDCKSGIQVSFELSAHIVLKFEEKYFKCIENMLCAERITLTVGPSHFPHLHWSNIKWPHTYVYDLLQRRRDFRQRRINFSSLLFLRFTRHHKKRPHTYVYDLCGGGGIRTPGTSRYAGFQDRCIRPLCHSSLGARFRARQN